MRRLLGMGVLGAVLATGMPALAQAQTPMTTDDRRPATTTLDGDTGLWYVPTAEVLPRGKFSASFYRDNQDDGQGFADVSIFPATFGVGVGRAELFGHFQIIKRIDRDTRPLFFHSTSQEADTGTGGGIFLPGPKHRSPWSDNQLGDFWVGGKLNLLSQADERPVAAAIRARVKLPTASDDDDDFDAVGSGKVDSQFDGIISARNSVVEMAGFGGVIIRGNPDGYSLTNGFKWGVGAGFPQEKGFLITTELFGESYFDKTITGPAGVFGQDGSLMPTTTNLKSPVIFALGGTWQHRSGFFAGVAGSWNLTQETRGEATPIGSCFTCDDHSFDKGGFQVRIGYHPGVRKFVPPPPPPPVTPPVTQPPPPPNRPPTVSASCSPATIEPGQTGTLTADASDPDGDALTYQWTVTGGTISAPTNRQTPFTAPTTPGNVTATVTVNDGHGNTANATATCNIPAPPRREYVFEDVHFDFDRYTLIDSALRILDEAVAAMQQDATLNLTIEGHTDNIGTNEYNMALGERRAGSVRDYLISRGINANRLRTVSFGEENPKHDNSREETRRLNRRAALVVRLGQ